MENISFRQPILLTVILLILAACQNLEETPTGLAMLQPVDPTGTFALTPESLSTKVVVQPSPQPSITTTGIATHEPIATPTQVINPTPTIDPSAPVVVTIEGVDRITSTGTFFPGTGPTPWPGVILLHMSGDNRHVWEENGFADLLVENGYAVLAIDIRSHGKSGGDPSWENGEIDVRRWWNYFTGREDIDSARTALVGGSIGANLALFTAYQKPDVRTVVLLSPGLAYNDADMTAAMSEYGARPSLIVASEDDLFPAAEDATILAEVATGEVETLIYLDAGHGTNMLLAEPELAGIIIDWLDRYVKPLAESSVNDSRRG